MKKIIRITAFLLAALMLFSIVSCDNGDPKDTGETAASVTEKQTEPQPQTDKLETAPASTEAPQTEPATTEAPPVLTGPTDAAYVTFEDSQILKCVTEKSAVKTDVTLDEKAGYLLKISTAKKTSDPYVMFNYKKYMKAFGLTCVEASEYKYITHPATCQCIIFN